MSQWRSIENRVLRLCQPCGPDLTSFRIGIRVFPKSSYALARITELGHTIERLLFNRRLVGCGGDSPRTSGCPLKWFHSHRLPVATSVRTSSVGSTGIGGKRFGRAEIDVAGSW